MSRELGFAFPKMEVNSPHDPLLRKTITSKTATFVYRMHRQTDLFNEKEAVKNFALRVFHHAHFSPSSLWLSNACHAGNSFGARKKFF